MPEKSFKGEYKRLMVDNNNRLELPDSIATAIEYNDYLWLEDMLKRKDFSQYYQGQIPMYVTNLLQENKIIAFHASHLDDKARNSYKRIYSTYIDDHHRLALMGIAWHNRFVDIYGKDNMFIIQLHSDKQS